MTENEKAATFIGWKIGDADLDMGLPENYLSAFFKLAERKVFWEIAYDPDQHWRKRYACVVADVMRSRQRPNLSQAVVEALAALYDAEHPTESR